MRFAALALIACGCNQVFDLQPTKLVDAAVIPIDAPRVCPAIGTPLHVGRELRQVVRQDCNGYTISSATGLALASCLETTPAYGYFPYQGAIDSVLEKFDLGLKYVDTVRLFPEGDRMFARGYNDTAQVASIFERSSEGLWMPTKESLPPNVSGYSIGTFTSGPDRRIAMVVGQGVDEYAQGDDGTWTLVKTYPIADWGCTAVYGATLSTDGLRMLVTCYRTDISKIETRYAERTARSELFGALQTLDGAPQGVTMMVINDDCSRIYFSALSSIFAAELD